MCVCVFVCACVCVCVCTEPHELLFHVVRITGARHDHLEHVAHFDRHFVFRFRKDAGHIWDEGKEVLVDFRAHEVGSVCLHDIVPGVLDERESAAHGLKRLIHRN